MTLLTQLTDAMDFEPYRQSDSELLKQLANDESDLRLDARGPKGGGSTEVFRRWAARRWISLVDERMSAPAFLEFDRTLTNATKGRAPEKRYPVFPSENNGAPADAKAPTAETPAQAEGERKIRSVLAVAQDIVGALADVLNLRAVLGDQQARLSDPRIAAISGPWACAGPIVDGKAVVSPALYAINEQRGHDCAAHWGVVDQMGRYTKLPDTRSPLGYLFLSEGLIAYGRTFVDDKGNDVGRGDWDEVEFFSDGLAPVRKGEKWGFVDKSGKVIVPLDWDRVGRFKEGLAPVEKGDKWGVVDNTGKVIAPPRWNYLFDYSEGLAAAEKDGKWGFIDRMGRTVVPYEWNGAYDFYEGVAQVFRNQKYEFIDKTDATITPVEWDSAGYFHEGLAAVKRGGKWGFIDKTGVTVIAVEWDGTDFFSEGLAAVEKDGNWGFIDRTGRVVIHPDWDGPLFLYTLHFENGLSVVNKDDISGLIDNKGKLLLNLPRIKQFSKGMTLVNLDDTLGGKVYPAFGFLDLRF
jgi:WG containing repeat